MAMIRKKVNANNFEHRALIKFTQHEGVPVSMHWKNTLTGQELMQECTDIGNGTFAIDSYSMNEWYEKNKN